MPLLTLSEEMDKKAKINFIKLKCHLSDFPIILLDKYVSYGKYDSFLLGFCAFSSQDSVAIQPLRFLQWPAGQPQRRPFQSHLSDYFAIDERLAKMSPYFVNDFLE